MLRFPSVLVVSLIAIAIVGAGIWWCWTHANDVVLTALVFLVLRLGIVK